MSKLIATLALAATVGGGSALSPEELSVSLGEREVTIMRMEGIAGDSGPLMISLHSNEKTSIAAAVEVLKASQGTFYVLVNQGQRRMPIYKNTNRVTIDPNRIFSEKGIIRDLKDFRIFRDADVKVVHAFGKYLIQRVGVRKGHQVIAMHNNTNGGFSIESYLPGGAEAGATAMVHRSKDDADNFFLVTEAPLFEALKTRGFNVVSQDNENAPDDGSLSVYCGRNGIPYVNVEAEVNDLPNQIRMLKALFEVLEVPAGSEPLNPPEVGLNSFFSKLFKHEEGPEHTGALIGRE